MPLIITLTYFTDSLTNATLMMAHHLYNRIVSSSIPFNPSPPSPLTFCYPLKLYASIDIVSWYLVYFLIRQFATLLQNYVCRIRQRTNGLSLSNPTSEESRIQSCVGM